MAKNNFFIRAKIGANIAKVNVFTAVCALLSPYILLIAAGIYINGIDFFNLNKMISVNNFTVNPYIGFSCIIFITIYIAYTILNLILCGGDLISVDNNVLIIKRITEIKISEINFNKSCVVGFKSNIIRIYYGAAGNHLDVPLVFANVDASVAWREIVELRRSYGDAA